MATTMTRFGKVPMINGRPVNRFAFEVVEDGQVVESQFFQAKWDAGAKLYARRRKGAQVIGYAWDEEKQDYIEYGDELYAEGMKRAERSAKASGRPMREINPAQFTDAEAQEVKSFGTFVVQLAVAGKKEQLDRDTVSQAITDAIAFMFQIGGEAPGIKAAITAYIKEHKETND